MYLLTEKRQFTPSRGIICLILVEVCFYLLQLLLPQHMKYSTIIYVIYFNSLSNHFLLYYQRTKFNMKAKYFNQ